MRVWSRAGQFVVQIIDYLVLVMQRIQLQVADQPNVLILIVTVSVYTECVNVDSG